MKETFAKAVAFTLSYEGGFTNNPRDPGGATNRGITILTLTHHLRRQATITDVRNLSAQMAIDIYRETYWTAIGGDSLPKGVDVIAFDVCANMGPGRAIEFLHQTSNLPPVDRIHRIDALRCGFWRALRTFPVFGNGWLRRETACLGLALSVA